MTDPADRAGESGRPVLDGERVRLRPGGTFHDGLLMDLLHDEITRPPGKKIKPPRV
jgi:hypothetical protein